MYNITNITSANSVVDQFVAVNELSGHLLFMIVYLVLFVVTLVIFKKTDFKTVLTYDSFFMAIMCVLGFSLNFIPSSYVILSVIVFLGSLIIYKFVES